MLCEKPAGGGSGADCGTEGKASNISWSNNGEVAAEDVAESGSDIQDEGRSGAVARPERAREGRKVDPGVSNLNCGTGGTFKVSRLFDGRDRSFKDFALTGGEVGEAGITIGMIGMGGIVGGSADRVITSNRSSSCCIGRLIVLMLLDFDLERECHRSGNPNFTLFFGPNDGQAIPLLLVVCPIPIPIGLPYFSSFVTELYPFPFPYCAKSSGGVTTGAESSLPVDMVDTDALCACLCPAKVARCVLANLRKLAKYLDPWN